MSKTTMSFSLGLTGFLAQAMFGSTTGFSIGSAAYTITSDTNASPDGTTVSAVPSAQVTDLGRKSTQLAVYCKEFGSQNGNPGSELKKKF